MDVETESKWGVAIKAMGTDPLGSKIVKEVDRAGCCYPPFLCVIDKNTVKYARDRSYLWVLEAGIEENLYAPQVCCGCISIQALCPCCKCPGQDNIAKIYFDHPPFMGPKTGFATEKDICWCCYCPKVCEGIPCGVIEEKCFTPCYGGSVVLVRPMNPCCKPCCNDEEWFKYATRCSCCPCSGPGCCTVPLLIYVKDSRSVKDALYTALTESLERQKTTYKAPPGSQAWVAMTAHDAPMIANMDR